MKVWCKREKYLIRQSFTPWTCKILIYVDQHCFRHLHKCPHQHHHNLNDVHPCFPRHHDDDCQDGHGHDEDDHLISPPLPGESLVVQRIPIRPNEYWLPVPKCSWPENLKIFLWPWSNFSCSMDSNMDSKPYLHLLVTVRIPISSPNPVSSHLVKRILYDGQLMMEQSSQKSFHLWYSGKAWQCGQRWRWNTSAESFLPGRLPVLSVYWMDCWVLV